MKRVIIGVLAAGAVLAAVLTACNLEKEEYLTAVTGITLNKTFITLSTGDTLQLLPTVRPGDASNQSVAWSSSNPVVATVRNGTITAILAGATTITATTEDGNKTASCSLTVLPSVAGVTLDRDSAALFPGDTLHLAATVHPAITANQAVAWKSNDTAVVTVVNGKVTAKSVGVVAIIATAKGNKTDTCTVTVKPIVVRSIALDKRDTALFTGDTLRLTATIVPGNASNKVVAWTSSNTTVATVAGGKVTAVSAGTAVITATAQDGNHTAACTVTIAKFIPVTSVTINTTTAALAPQGATLQLTVTVWPANASRKEVTWSSSDPSVATVSNSGLVVSKAAGRTTITVTTQDGPKTAACILTVGGPVTGITLNRTTAKVNRNDIFRLTATVSPTHASNQRVEWTSNNSVVATVLSSGLVSCRSEGTAKITATTEDGNYSASCVVTVSDKGVAINGLFWAEYNVDAPGTFTSKPETIGMFYQWNRRKGWPATGSVSGWVQNMATGGDWSTTNDPCPAGWRVPTVDDFAKLLDEKKVIQWKNDLQNGVRGIGFYDSELHNDIFLPYTGYRNSTGTLDGTGSGYYWAREARGEAYNLYFNSSTASQDSSHGSVGFSVRCVHD